MNYPCRVLCVRAVFPDLEMVNEAVVPHFNVHTQFTMTLDLLPAQNELQSLIYRRILPFGRGGELLLAIHSHLAGSAVTGEQAMSYSIPGLYRLPVYLQHTINRRGEVVCIHCW